MSVPLSLREAIQARLLASPAITTLVGSRIYFGALPQTASLLTGPALTFSIISRPYGLNLGGADGTSSGHIQFSAWSLYQKTSDQLAQAVRDRFCGFAGSIGGLEITACIPEDEVDLPEPPRAGTDQWLYHIAVNYRMNHRVSLPTSLGA